MRNIKIDQDQDYEHDSLREEAMIVYQKREEVEAAWREHQSVVLRKPAKIVINIHDQVQADNLPF
jgi:hypothetical protein